MPSIRPEREWGLMHAASHVAGVDEAGRGPLAGPVVAAAVIFDPQKPRPRGLDDSKKLSAATRTCLAAEIRERAVAWAVVSVPPEVVDELNVLGATRRAVNLALAALRVTPGAIVTDALTLPGEKRPVLPIVKGDAKSSSIAAASILAKTERDAEMDCWASEFPGYGWETNRGYPTNAHFEALQRLGPTTIHRLTFAGVAFFPSELRWSISGSALRKQLLRTKSLSSADAHEVTRLPLVEREEIASLAARLNR